MRMRKDGKKDRNERRKGEKWRENGEKERMERKTDMRGEVEVHRWNEDGEKNK
jgi:hypothetical protein